MDLEIAFDCGHRAALGVAGGRGWGEGWAWGCVQGRGCGPSVI